MVVDLKAQRRELIEAELREYDSTGSKTTYPLEFRGVRENLKVIRLNPGKLLFNPQNSRIWAQVDEHPKGYIVRTDEDTAEAQEIIIELLRQTDKYKALKTELDQLGQKVPGLITVEGKLVNGNTRAAALLELGIDAIEVAVLPQTAGDDDIVAIEMTLQMQRLTQQDYSFTNELQMMKRFLDSGKTEKELAEKMAWLRRGEKKVREHMRYLEMINEVRDLSTAKVPYRAFDKKKETLKNLDEDYQRLINEGDIAAAEDLKWTRLTALILGVNKDQIRSMDEDFVGDEVISRLDGTETFDFIKEYSKEARDDGLGALLGEEEDPCPYDMRKLLKAALSGDDLHFTDDDMPLGMSTQFDRLQEAMTDAADDKILRNKRQGRLESPIKVIEEIRRKVVEVEAQFEDLTDTPGFKNGKLKYQLGKLVEEATVLLKKCDDVRH